VRYVQGDALHLPFADGAFDTVLLPEVLEHLHEPVAALAEAARVARRRVVASLPLGPDSDPTHVTEYERASALALFAGVAGLAVTATGMVGTWLIVTAEPATDC
jgi:ubiquinone/menaquinone biosynthesis C-methylase UbiE